MSQSMRVRLRGRDYLLRSGGDEEQLLEAVRLVEEKLAEQDALSAVDTHDRFILALLNLAGDLQKEKLQRRQLEEDIEKQRRQWLDYERESAERIASLVSRLENALEKDIPAFEEK